MKKIANSNTCLLMAILALFGVARPLSADFRFTVTGDPRSGYSKWEWALSEMTSKVGDEGAFHITAGDYYDSDPASTASGFYDRLKTEFGDNVVWYPTVGNHETGTTDMPWLRSFYDDHLAESVNPGPGPSPCHKTTYSWDYENAHFVQLNNYYDGETDEAGSAFSDALYDWLVDDLNNNTKPVVFVIYHEPAYPDGRGGKSSPDGWEQFWKLLNDKKVTAGLCADTHTYDRYQVDGDWETFTWEVDAGNAGRLSHGDSWQTFIDITVYDSCEVEFATWQGLEDEEYTKTDTWFAQPPPPELVGHWKLDEGSGTTAEDSSGENNDGTLGGDPQWVSGVDGNALTLDGDDYVDLGNPSVLDFGTSDFTLCAWVKNPGGNNVVAKGGDQSGGIRYALQVGSGVQLLVDDNIDKESVSGGSGLGDGEWHHVAGTRDGSALRVYIDSNEVASESLPHSPYDLSGTSQHNAYIGAVWQHQDNQLGDFYTGSVDDVRIYSGALTSEELWEVMGEEPDTTPPAAPTGLSATAGDATVSLDWNDNSEPDLAVYDVYRSTSTGGPYSVLDFDLTQSDYTDNSVSNGTTYYYVVTAIDTSENESGYSNEDSATPEAVPDTTPPAAPTGLAATPGDATVSLDWNDNSEGDLDGYNVLRSTTSGSGYSQLNGSLLSSSDYTDNSVSNDTTYYYVVTAEDTSSNESGYSNEDSATPTAGGDGYQESGGVCTMEAENATVDQRSDNITWVLATSESGYVGSGYMTPPDNTGTTVTWSTGCELAWDVYISTPGTYYMAVRRIAKDNGDDSATAGVGGSERDDNTFNGTASSWKWSRGDDFDLGSLSVGTHTIQIRRREDGLCIDRVMIADSWSKLPADGSTESGPAESPGGPAVVFSDSFENGEWNGLWNEDSQADWKDSTQRSVDGSYSAEVDGSASDAALTSGTIDLDGKTNATVTFSWYIESGLDSGEYLAFDVSTNGGGDWVQKAILQGNVDPENTWHHPSVNVTDISGGFKIRFRGKMSKSSEDADVDMVSVRAW